MMGGISREIPCGLSGKNWRVEVYPFDNYKDSLCGITGITRKCEIKVVMKI